MRSDWVTCMLVSINTLNRSKIEHEIGLVSAIKLIIIVQRVFGRVKIKNLDRRDGFSTQNLSTFMVASSSGSLVWLISPSSHLSNQIRIY